MFVCHWFFFSYSSLKINRGEAIIERILRHKIDCEWIPKINSKSHSSSLSFPFIIPSTFRFLLQKKTSSQIIFSYFLFLYFSHTHSLLTIICNLSFFETIHFLLSEFGRGSIHFNKQTASAAKTINKMISTQMDYSLLYF